MEHIQLVELLYKALGTGDAETLSGLLHSGFVGRTTEGLPLELGGVFSGAEEMRDKVWWRIGRHYEAKAVPGQFIPTQDGRLLVLGTYEGRGRKSERALDAAYVHLFEFSDGLISGLTQITDSVRWADALGGAERPLETVRLTVSEGIAHIRLSRPDARNALNYTMAADLHEAARRCGEIEGLRAVLLTGDGPAFTVGGDIKVFDSTDPSARPALMAGMATQYHEALRRFLKLDAPVIAAVHGAVAGGGLGLIYCADIVIAAEGTRFALGFGAIGLSSDGGNSWFLPRLVGPRRAAELYFEDRVLNAGEAADWGLVSRVVPRESLAEEALAAARKLADGPTRAYGEMRRLLRDSWDRDAFTHFAAEEAALARTAATADAGDAFTAFLAKRPATFEGK